MNRYRWILTGILWLATDAAFAGDLEFYAQDGRTYKLLHGSGTRTGTVNFVLLGDGFSTAAELQHYEALCDIALQTFLETQPYGDHKNDINLWRINVRSRESGISKKLWCGKRLAWAGVTQNEFNSDPAVIRNTPFEMCRWITQPGGDGDIFHDTRSGDLPRNAGGESTLDLALAEAGLSRNSGNVYPIILINDLEGTEARDITRRRTFSTVSALLDVDTFRVTLLHEVGHLFGELGEEYGVTVPNLEITTEWLKDIPNFDWSDANRSLRENIRDVTHKWFGYDKVWTIKPHLLADLSPVVKVYTPSRDCIMRCNTTDVCPPCLRALRGVLDMQTGRPGFRNPPSRPVVQLVRYENGIAGTPTEVDETHPATVRLNQDFRLDLSTQHSDPKRPGADLSVFFFVTLSDRLKNGIDPYTFTTWNLETPDLPMSHSYSPWIVRAGGGTYHRAITDYPSGSFLHYRTADSYVLQVWAVDSGGLVSEARSIGVDVRP